MRALLILAVVTGVSALAPATTLEQLPLPEMARQSTAIVRGRVLGSSGVRRGSDVYTVYRLDVAESWKRPNRKREGLLPENGGGTIEVAVPGGVAGGIRQMVAGAPQLRPGGDYLIFLWTSRSGITQVIGLSQGLFGVGRDSQGEWIASRGAANESMLDANGRAVRDEPIAMKLSELRARVEQALKPREAK